MARTLEIWRTGGGGYTDYTAWLLGMPNAPLFKRTHELNKPKVLEFYVTDGVASFVNVEEGNRVRVKTSGLSDFFTGYLMKNPEPVLLGGTATTPNYAYKCTAQDETLALEWPSSGILPTLPPFIGKTQGQIVKGLVSALGSSLDTTSVDDGILMPYFRVHPNEGFWDAVRRLSDRTNMALWVTAGLCYYQQFNKTSFGYVASETDFNPNDIRIVQSDNPVYNDVRAVGDPEPQAYVSEHYVADGFTGSFPLKFPLFGAESSKLLEDDWTETAINHTLWTETDPDGVLSISASSLLFNSGASANNNRLTAVQGLEMAGVIELRAGRVRFNGQSSCLIGGIFSTDTGLLAQCVAGFSALKTGGTTRLQAVVNGALAGPTYDVLSAKTYQFVVTVNCAQASRRNREFFSRTGQFGGSNVAAGATISFAVTELSDNVGDNPLRVLDYTATYGSVVPFAYYTLLAGPANATDSVNLSLNFTSLRSPVQASLFTKKVTDSAFVQRRLGDKSDPEAWAAISTGTEGNSLDFFGDRVPDVLEKITFQYRQSGLARARIQKLSSITSEVSKAGDSGIRAIELPAVTPAPQNAVELESAIQAFIDDHTQTIFEGSWSFNLLALKGVAFQADTFQNDTFQVSAPGTFFDPVPGRFLSVSCPTRFPAFSALVSSVVVSFNGVDRSTNGENVQVDLNYGQLRRFDDGQPLAPTEDVLTGPNDSVTAQPIIDYSVSGDTFARDVGWVSFDGSITSSTVEIDCGVGADSSFEVRKTDAGWASSQTINLVSSQTSETFTVPRTARDTLVYVKNKDSGGRVSRYPSVVRVVYPAVPPTPTGTIDASNPLTPIIRLGGDNVDVSSVEVRASDNSTVLFSRSVLTDADLVFPVASNQASLTFFCYFINLIGEYSTSFSPTVSVWGSSHVSYRPLSNPLTATDAGASATISIAGFTQRSGLIDISVSSGTISSLSFGTLYYIYYDDPTFAGGGVTFHATVTKEVSLSGNNRFFVGSIRTPLSGAPNTNGNSDGGSGAQFGALTTLIPVVSSRFSTDPLDGSVTNLSSAIDGDLTTYAEFSNSPSGIERGNDVIFSGPPGVSGRYSSLTLKIRREVINDLSDALTPNDLPYILNYSLDGGESFIELESVAHGVALSLDTISVSLPVTINPGNVVFFIAWEVPASGTGSIVVRIYGTWLEAIDA